MADTNEKYLDQDGIQWLWRKITSLFVRKDGNKVLSDNNYSSAEKEKLAGIEPGANRYTLPVATRDVLGGVKIGSGLEADEYGVVHTVANPDINVRWDHVTNTPSTLAGYGINDAATKSELAAVEEKVSRIYRPCGSVDTVADLDNIVDPEYGDTYNVLENGHNYAWAEGKNGAPDFWDDLGGSIDLSGYWSKAELVALTKEEIDVITGDATSEEAFEEIMRISDYVELGDDIALAKQYTIDKNFTIDLAGHTLSSAIENTLFNVVGGTLTIRGAGTLSTQKRIADAWNGGRIVLEEGNFVTAYEGFKAIDEGSEVRMDGGHVTTQETALSANRGGKIEMNGGLITTIDNMGIATNGTSGEGGNMIVINGGKIDAYIASPGWEACAVYVANNDTLVMNGGELIANNGAGLCMRAGNVTINNGSITATGEAGTTGRIADGKFQMGKSAVIYHETANYPGKAGMKLSINGGTFTGVDHSVEVLSNEATPNVSVTGGNFTPAYPEA